jgi:hypothetical protein
MQTQTMNSGFLSLLLSGEELEQLKFCVASAEDHFDYIGEAAMGFDLAELAEVAKRLNKSAKPDADSRGFELPLQKNDLPTLYTCVVEIARIYSRLKDDGKNPTLKQVERLRDHFKACLD